MYYLYITQKTDALLQKSKKDYWMRKNHAIKSFNVNRYGMGKFRDLDKILPCGLGAILPWEKLRSVNQLVALFCDCKHHCA